MYILYALTAVQNMRGIRQIANWHPTDPSLRFCKRNLLVDSDFKRGYALLQKYGLSFDMQVPDMFIHTCVACICNIVLLLSKNSVKYCISVEYDIST